MKAIFASSALLLGVLLSVPQAHATDTVESYKATLEGSNGSYNGCMQNAEGHIIEIQVCQEAAFKTLDALLNQSYQALRNSNKDDKPFLDALKKEQLAWIGFRDEAIRNVGARFGDSPFRVVTGTDVSLEMMRNRIALFLFLMPEAE